MKSEMHLNFLESESIGIIRDAYSSFKRPVVLFSGGKDSIVLMHLIFKAFYPSRIPFPVLHIDTGRNFSETIEFRDSFVKKMDLHLIVGTVQELIDKLYIVEDENDLNSRNFLQIDTLKYFINQYSFDCCFGGARRDEEKSRAKERIFSHRDEEGLWNPKTQRPEVWKILNERLKSGEHFRVFPLSNWTEKDIWEYIMREELDIPSLYFSHERKVVVRGNLLLPVSQYLRVLPNDKVEKRMVRFRTCGDINITGAIDSHAITVEDIIYELENTRTSERSSRYDDKASENAMEERKRVGYF